MKERPILFSAPMVGAILDGRKSQTRRVAKEFAGRDDLDAILRRFPNQHGCPHGEPGDRLWVRETWAAFDADGMHPGRQHDLRDGPWPLIAYGVAKDFPKGTARPAIHMPRWASRITLEITGMRVERLQDISRGDAMEEGCPFPNMATGDDPRAWFCELWRDINGDESWDSNPWVWVIEFARITTEDGK